MGKYAELHVKNTSESNLNKINSDLLKLGIPYETHNGVLYGSFPTIARLQEDARFMNEDPEGLKQLPDQPRPITVEHLSQYSWLNIGKLEVKINSMNDDEVSDFNIVFQYAHNNPDLFDWDKSTNCDIATLNEYGLSVKKPESPKELSKSERIKKQLKEKLGYNQRQVSVRSDPGGLCWSFTFTIRDPQVIYQDIKDFADTVRSIDYCEASGEILSGGNTYTHLKLSDRVQQEWNSKYLPQLEKHEKNFNESSGVTIGEFTIFKINNILKIDHRGQWMNMNYHSIATMATDMFIKDQTPDKPEKKDIKNMETNQDLSTTKPTPSFDSLMEKFDSVSIDYEARIAPKDLLFCQQTQQIYNELTSLLNQQLTYFEQKIEQGPDNEAFNLSEHHGKFSVSTAYTSSEVRWDQFLKYSPLFSIAAIKNNLAKAQQSFINEIRNYFSSKYNINLSLNELETLEDTPDYNKILEYIFQETDGLDLFDAGVSKIKHDFSKTIRRSTKIKGVKITFQDYVYYDSLFSGPKIHYNCKSMPTLLAALSYFETGSTTTNDLISNQIPHHNHMGKQLTHDPIEIEGLQTITKIKFYKNGNVDLHFINAETAQRFWNQFEISKALKNFD